jgi:hypothetical protein
MDDWIEWTGDAECPISAGISIQVRLTWQPGQIVAGFSDSYDWTQVFSYRVVNSGPAQEDPAEVGQ